MHKPDDKLRGKVEGLAAFGMPHQLIADEIGVSINTLRKYYREELDNGLPKANAKMAQSIYREGLGLGKSGRVNIRAAIYWMNARAGWTDKGGASDPGASAEAPAVPNEVAKEADDYDFTGWDVDEVKKLKADLKRARRNKPDS